MNILPYKKNHGWANPFKELERIERDLLSIIDGNAPQSFGYFPNENRTWLPVLDIDENDKEIVVNAELPGIEKGRIQVLVKDGVLTIKGEKKEQSKAKENGFRKSERLFGSFQRAIDLGTSIDESKVQASYKDGILEVRLPKTEEEKPKEIKIDIK